MAHKPGASARSSTSVSGTGFSSTSGLGASKDRREKRRRTGLAAFSSTPGDARLSLEEQVRGGAEIPPGLRLSPLVQGGAALARFAAERGIDVQFAGDSFIPQRDSTDDVLLRRRRGALGTTKVAQRSARLSTIGSGPVAQSRGSAKRRRQRSGRGSTINTAVSSTVLG